MPNVSWATLDFARSAFLPCLAGGMKISTSVPSGTGNGCFRMTTSPLTYPVYCLVAFPLGSSPRRVFDHHAALASGA
jgi:hypothetical protein